MKKFFTLVLVFSSFRLFAQEAAPVKLTMVVTYSMVDNTNKEFTPFQAGSFSIRLHDNGTYSWTDQTSLSQKTTSGVFTLTGDKLQLTGDDGTVKIFKIEKFDNVITKLSAGNKVYYMVRSIDA